MVHGAFRAGADEVSDWLSALMLDLNGALEYLRSLGAHQIPHSGGTLLQHLVGTADLLNIWGAPAYVCRAGLFHSIYGTAHFKTATVPISARPQIMLAIGSDSEALAYAFCALDRPRVLLLDKEPDYPDRLGHQRISLTDDQWRDLRLIEAANLQDQGERSPRVAWLKKVVGLT